MDYKNVIGIDIGGSHITAALVDIAQGKLVPNTYSRLRVNAQAPADQIISCWAEAINKVLNHSTSTENRIGIAMPGPFDYEQGVSFIKNQDKYHALYQLNVKDMLADALKVLPEHIRFINDACSFLTGEVLGGAVQGYDHVIGLTLGTGLGTATYHEGISKDADLWNMPFKDSIAEEYISTRWFVNTYAKLSGSLVKDVKELALRYETDEKAKAVFELFGENLGLFLLAFIEKEQPEAVVLGGNIALSSALFLPATERVLKAHAINIPIKMADLGEEAALIGAAGCWHHTRFNQNSSENSL